MNNTKHCLVRCKQRGICESDIELIRSFGTKVRKPGGVLEYFVTKKEKQKAIQILKQRIQRLDKVDGKAILVGDDGTVITVYHKT